MAAEVESAPSARSSKPSPLTSPSGARPIPSRCPANAPPTENSEARRHLEVDQAALGAADDVRGARGGGAAEGDRRVGADGEVGDAVAVDVAAGLTTESRPEAGATIVARVAVPASCIEGRRLARQQVGAAGARAGRRHVGRVGGVGEDRDVVLAVAVDVADAGHLEAEVVVFDRVGGDDPVAAGAEQLEVQRPRVRQVRGAEDYVGGAARRVDPGRAAVVLVRPGADQQVVDAVAVDVPRAADAGARLGALLLALDPERPPRDGPGEVGRTKRGPPKATYVAPSQEDSAGLTDHKEAPPITSS